MKTHLKIVKNTTHVKGQTLSEYLILTALIGIASMGVVQVLSKNLRARLGQVAEALGGNRKEIAPEPVRQEQYQIRDLGDFTEAFRDNDQ